MNGIGHLPTGRGYRAQPGLGVGLGRDTRRHHVAVTGQFSHANQRPAPAVAAATAAVPARNSFGRGFRQVGPRRVAQLTVDIDVPPGNDRLRCGLCVGKEKGGTGCDVGQLAVEGREVHVEVLSRGEHARVGHLQPPLRAEPSQG